ncbi:hypothetical protein GXW71_06340 [Roseomonas hellenica]|uniref:Uncharacterized protein n=1 Tax=Plastoroseomonas hellenica TaxID=2687306 RepID=A0ABS5EUJ4_9PROT|nr:hypothetical protein [Plastoroseomonas hellenica]MBR0663973.1 hypothetical protein [Plastoroseomonas hellenica]
MPNAGEEKRIITVNLDSLIDFICNKKKPRYIRAVRLYEFSVAIFLCEGIERVENSNSDLLLVDEKYMRLARAVSAARLLGHIEEEDRSLNGSRSYIERFGLRGYVGLLRKFLDADGWATIQKISKFERDVKASRIEAFSVAKYLDFALRRICHDGYAGSGTISEAIENATYLQEYKIHVGTREGWARWAKRGHSGLWFWCNYRHRWPVRPELPTQKGFARALLYRLDSDYLRSALFCYAHAYRKLHPVEGFRDKLAKVNPPGERVEPDGTFLIPIALADDWYEIANMEKESRKAAREKKKLYNERRVEALREFEKKEAGLLRSAFSRKGS